MSVVIVIPPGMWILLPGTDWEVFQDSGEIVFLSDESVTMQIRRASSAPRIWGPRPPLLGTEPGGGITR